MNHHTRELFSESALGGLLPALPKSGGTIVHPGAVREVRQAQAHSFVESLGLPRETPPLILAQVLEDIHVTDPAERLDRLYRPGWLSRLFSQSAAEASYAMALLAIVESTGFQATLARLRSH